MKKKIISLFLSVLFVLCIASSIPAATVSADTSAPLTLSEMTELECLQFIKDYGVEIPDDFEDEIQWAPFIKKTITLVEDDPYYDFVYNYHVTLEFAQSIQAVVNDYYDISPIEVGSNTMLATSDSLASYYTLQDSEVYGTWSEAMRYYNCYAYALNKADAFYAPGSFSGNTYNLSIGLDTLVTYIEEDLRALNYVCLETTIYRPTSEILDNGRNAICFRIGSEDYHFMKLGEEGWYHKPGNSMTLKYKYIPATARIWTNERVLNTIAREGNTTYTSAIYFFIYSRSHSFSYTYIGSGCHKSVCNDCGYTVPYTQCSPVGNCSKCGS